MRNFTFTAPTTASMQKVGALGGFAVLAATTTFGLAATAGQQPAQAATKPATTATATTATTLAAATDKAATERTADTVSRSADRVQVQQVAYKTPVKAEKAEKVEKAAKKVYPNNLDGWIRESLDIMHDKGIPGTYHGLHKNIIRESSGNPKAINDWDINAINGIPSKGLLQVIPPTFEAYHVDGTAHDIWNPVSNITAAANYAADKYGSIDNVNSAY